MNENYRTELPGVLHETAAGLHKIGVIDNEEMLEYDRDCLIQVPNFSSKSTQSTPNSTPAIV